MLLLIRSINITVILCNLNSQVELLVLRFIAIAIGLMQDGYDLDRWMASHWLSNFHD